MADRALYFLVWAMPGGYRFVEHRQLAGPTALRAVLDNEVPANAMRRYAYGETEGVVLSAMYASLAAPVSHFRRLFRRTVRLLAHEWC